MQRLMYIQGFIELYNNPVAIPQVIFNGLSLAVASPEHPIWHPEGTLERHINIVVGRALEFEQVELHFAAILHDITKHGFDLFGVKERVGEMKTLPEGRYWQNVYHAEQAAALMEHTEVKNWVSAYCDFNVTQTIVKNHMKMKNYLAGLDGRKGGMGEKKCSIFRESFEPKVFELMLCFSQYCDNMKI